VRKLTVSFRLKRQENEDMKEARRARRWRGMRRLQPGIGEALGREGAERWLIWIGKGALPCLTIVFNCSYF
jgi:hypothetical protein